MKSFMSRICEVADFDYHAGGVIDPATGRLVFTSWEGQPLDPTVTLDASEDELRSRFESIGLESKAAYPLDEPIEAGFKLFQVALMETMVTRELGADRLRFIGDMLVSE